MYISSWWLVLSDFFSLVNLSDYFWICFETGVTVHMNFVRKYFLSISWLIITILTLAAGVVMALAGSFGGALCAALIAVMSAYVIYEFDWPILWGPLFKNLTSWLKSKFK